MYIGSLRAIFGCCRNLFDNAMKFIAMMTQTIKRCALQVYICSALLVLVSNSPGAVRGETPQIVQRLSAKPRWQDYLRAKQKAYASLDQLQVDPIELIQHGIKGKKKLAEILDAYVVAYRYATDQAEQAAWTSYARILLCSNEFVYLD